MPPRILIVDADPVERLHVEGCARRFGFAAEALDDPAAALARLRGPGADRPDLLILDLDAQGFELLAALAARGFAPPAIALAGGPLAESPGPALRAGAFDVLQKPPAPERLKTAIHNALRAARLEAEVRRLSRRAREGVSLAEFRGTSAEMERALRLAARAARSNLPALIEGEAGVGKETLARAIHAASGRYEKPFLALRCAAHEPETLEAALFGDDGLVLRAQGGSLFLGDVCELPPPAQARLLRLVSDGELTPAGGGRPLRPDVRLIASTRRNLIERVKASRLREDLYYRLGVDPILLPPLRLRVDEIEEFSASFCAEFCAEQGRLSRGLSAPALALLRAYDWPGNVRELEATIARAVALAQGAELGVEDFPALAARVEGFAHVPPLAESADLALEEGPDEIEAPQAQDGATDARPSPLICVLGEDNEARPLADIEEEAIRFALAHYRGRLTRMARKLGVGRSTLYRKLKAYGLAGGRGPAEPAAQEGGADGAARPEAAA